MALVRNEYEDALVDTITRYNKHCMSPKSDGFPETGEFNHHCISTQGCEP